MRPRIHIKGLKAACSNTKKIPSMFPGTAVAIYYDFWRKEILSTEVYEGGEIPGVRYAGPEHDTPYAALFCVAHRPITVSEISYAFMLNEKYPHAKPVHYIKEERK